MPKREAEPAVKRQGTERDEREVNKAEADDYRRSAFSVMHGCPTERQS